MERFDLESIYLSDDQIIKSLLSRSGHIPVKFLVDRLNATMVIYHENRLVERDEKYVTHRSFKNIYVIPDEEIVEYVRHEFPHVLLTSRMNRFDMIRIYIDELVRPEEERAAINRDIISNALNKYRDSLDSPETAFNQLLPPDYWLHLGKFDSMTGILPFAHQKYLTGSITIKSFRSQTIAKKPRRAFWTSRGGWLYHDMARDGELLLVKINLARVYVLHDSDSFDYFVRKYGTKDTINWRRVALHYDGFIIFPPYYGNPAYPTADFNQFMDRYFWTTGYDLISCAIWNPQIIRKIYNIGPIFYQDYSDYVYGDDHIVYNEDTDIDESFEKAIVERIRDMHIPGLNY